MTLTKKGDIENPTPPSVPLQIQIMKGIKFFFVCLLLAIIAGGIDLWRWTWHGAMVYSGVYIIGVIHYIITIGLLWYIDYAIQRFRCGNVMISPSQLFFIILISLLLMHAVGLFLGIPFKEFDELSRIYPSFWTYSVSSIIALTFGAFPVGTIYIIAECTPPK